MTDELVEIKTVLEEKGIQRALTRMAHEVIERNRGSQDLCIIGIHTGGVFLAQRLQSIIKEIEGTEVPSGMIDITLYRDDVFIGLPQPEVNRTEIPFNVQGKRIVLVDDVLYTGRTVRAALQVIIDFGRPKAVWLAVLVDRGHRELPIRPDFVGLEVPTERHHSIRVELRESVGADRVVLRSSKEEKP